MVEPLITVAHSDDHVSTICLQRPPHNYLTVDLVRAVADELDQLEASPACRAVVLCSNGKNFSAGGLLGDDSTSMRAIDLYEQGLRVYRFAKPLIAAVQGAAVGGGLGLALAADFRVAAPQARFCANFARLGVTAGMGTSLTLPLVVGQQRALHMMMTGRRVAGDEALAIGLADELVPLDELGAASHAFAAEIAGSAPLVVTAMKQTARRGLVDQFEATIHREAADQEPLWATADAAEGIAAMNARRPPNFGGA